MRAFIYYGLSGGVNTILTYLLYVGLVQIVDYRIAIPITYAVGIALAYVIHGRFVFRSYGSVHRFVLVYAFLFLLNLAITWQFVAVFGWRAETAQLPAVAGCFIVGYLLSKRFVFRVPRSASVPLEPTEDSKGMSDHRARRG